jgi:hypothetical protein
MQPAFIDRTGIDRSHLTFILSVTTRIGYIGCDPNDAGQVVLAYLQSGFPFQGIRGTYRKTPIQLSKTVRGKLSCPLALYIEKSPQKYRAKNKACKKISCKPYSLLVKSFQVKVVYRQYEFQRQMLPAILVQLSEQAGFVDNQWFKLSNKSFHCPLVTMLGRFD